jgi:hypothetical protein
LTFFGKLVSAMPLILAGLRKNTKLFRFHVAQLCTFSCPTKQFRHVQMRWRLDAEMERLGYQTASSLCYVHRKASALWCLPYALARVGTLLMQF